MNYNNNNNSQGYSHGYGGNQQEQQGYDYHGQQQQPGYENYGGYPQQQQQQQQYGNNQYQQQEYRGQQQEQGYQSYNQPPGYDHGYSGGGRPDERYDYPAEKQDNGYYGENGNEDEDESGERGIKDKFVNTYVDQYGEQHSKLNKTTVGLAAVAVLGGAFLAKKYADKKKNEENMHRNQEIGGGGGMYDMDGGKSHVGGYPSNATMGPYGGGH
ncbi:hypothetical protein GGI20_002844 [Coemansia sp. BCRC 34301]|nr:hypothetical protein GGI20_002844 [Coemansia sp. BCRC 34301]